MAVSAVIFALGAHGVKENTFAVFVGDMNPVAALAIRSLALHLMELLSLFYAFCAVNCGLAWVSCELSRRGAIKMFRRAVEAERVEWVCGKSGVHLVNK